MKFVIAPDKFKGSLTGFEFCNAVEVGLRKVFPHAKILKMPLADGGDGTIEVVKHYLKGKKSPSRSTARCSGLLTPPMSTLLKVISPI